MSIRQPVTKEWLLEVCEKYRWGIDRAGPHKRTLEEPRGDMPPPKKPPRPTTAPTQA